ncbi:MAG: hypothetical protein RLZZ303_3295 [Candidatus Hydrogenedentota bacterium]
MGLAQLAPDRSLFTELTALLGLRTAATPPGEDAVAPAPRQDTAYLNGADNLSEAFEAAVYRRQSVQTALFFSTTSAAFSFVDDAGNTVAGQSEQLEFSFFREVRSEELARFRQRASNVESQLEGPSRQAYAQASARVAARFELSISISGEALGNFAGASEQLIDKDALFKLLLDFTDELLDKADTFFNDFFSSLGDGQTMSFDELFAQLQQQFAGGGLLESLRGLLGEGAVPAAGGAASGAGAVQLQFRFYASFEAQAEVAVMESDPVMLDLDDDGFELTSYKNGARFDILGNGGQQNTAFVTGGDAFLALDRNGNSRIDSGRELFGDQYGSANGYEELRKLDANGDGLINAHDPAFEALLLFKDNGNGLTEPGELITLRDSGIAEISLRYRNVDEATSGGNRMAQLATYRRADGSTGRAGDAILNYTV